MAVTWHCDICSKPTYVNPPFEYLFITDKDGNKIPKMSKMKQQNPYTGEIETVKIQDMKDLRPRAYIVRLSVGKEIIQKDFCKEHLDNVLPEIKALWNKLEKIKSK